MAHYAYISNAEFTTTERARLNEVNKEIDVIRQDNIDSAGYQLLYSSLYPTITQEDIMNEINSQYPEGDFTPVDVITITEELHESIYKSETLKQLELELKELEFGSEEYDSKLLEIQTEKEKIEKERLETIDQLYELEYNNTEDLIAEKETLKTTIANAISRVTNVIVGSDEIYYVDGDSSEIDAEIKALEETRNGKSQEEIIAIEQEMQNKFEEKKNIPKKEVDNTVYWEGYYYETKRTSYNSNIRKNFAGKGMIYDPVRDAFYAEQPYASWTLDEETCIWQPPTPKPEEGVWYWNEATLEWVEHPYKRYKSWVWGNKLTSWNGYYEGDEPIDDWFAPIECPDVSELSYSKRLSSYTWNEDTLNWVEL